MISVTVFATRVDRLELDGHGLDELEIEVGEMDYGVELGGILGMDFLIAAGAVLDLRELTIRFT